MKLTQRIKTYYRNLSLADKLRLSYFAVLIPMLILVVISVFNMYFGNARYKDIIESAVVAGEFSLDFKEDFDYETYLLVVENKTIEESAVYPMLDEAGRIVDRLDELTKDDEDDTRLSSAKQYLTNLHKYIERIELNLLTGNMYEENMLIWENDVQIVTALLSETLNEYIYNEVRNIQEARDDLDDHLDSHDRGRCGHSAWMYFPVFHTDPQIDHKTHIRDKGCYRSGCRRKPECPHAYRVRR